MDPTERDEKILEVAGSVADGEAIDWPTVNERWSESFPALRQLREVARISDAHRALLDTELPFRAWGPLDIRRHLASGGFGDVFLAQDRNLDRTVALKLLVEDDDRVASERFVEEARRLASVRHENVVTVHGVDRHEDRLGLWMEHVDGEPLDRWVETHGTMGASEAAAVGIEICRALAAVHAAGLVHRDVKLSNVVRAKGGRYVLMDFGSSSRRSALPSGRLSGTLAYLAPEVIEGRDSGTAVDVYALGVLLYRLTGGDYPVDAEQLRRPPATWRPVPLLDRNPDLPTRFVRVVERATDPDPSRRYASVGEMERALAGATAPSRPASPPATDRNVPWWRSKAVALVASAAVLAGLAIIAQRSWFLPFDARAEFHRFTARGTEERLRDGVAVRPGDQLFLEVESADRSWIYVVNADSRGEENLLFPVPGLDVQNPIPSGRHRIPGTVDGEARLWDVTTSGGRERLLVIASARPIDFLEDRIRGLRPVEPGRPIRLAEGDVADRMRGIGGISSPPSEEHDTGSSLEEFRSVVVEESGSGRGVRVWEWTLSNER